MAIIPKVYKDAVVSIGTRSAEGTVDWIATGFFIVRNTDEDNAIPFLITNRHVVEDKESIVVRMNMNNTNKVVDADLSLTEKGKSVVAFHSNPDVDIAVIRLNGSQIIEKGLRFPAFDIDKQALTSEELRQTGVDDGALIHMLGFTMALVNKDSGLPICRLGCIARMSESQIEEEHNMLIDVQNFPGNSGSPVILRPELSHLEGTKNLTETVLIGIIHSYIQYNDRLVSLQTGNIVEARSENSGLANAHPVEYIKEILDSMQI